MKKTIKMRKYMNLIKFKKFLENLVIQKNIKKKKIPMTFNG